MTKNAIIKDINAYIKANPGNWYVGIANDPKGRLAQHNAEDTAWIHCPADTAAIARAVEKAYTDAGYAGGPGGGNTYSKHVYAYLITDDTVENT